MCQGVRWALKKHAKTSKRHNPYHLGLDHACPAGFRAQDFLVCSWIGVALRAPQNSPYAPRKFCKRPFPCRPCWLWLIWPLRPPPAAPETGIPRHADTPHPTILRPLTLPKKAQPPFDGVASLTSPYVRVRVYSGRRHGV